MVQRYDSPAIVIGILARCPWATAAEIVSGAEVAGLRLRSGQVAEKIRKLSQSGRLRQWRAGTAREPGQEAAVAKYLAARRG